MDEGDHIFLAWHPCIACNESSVLVLPCWGAIVTELLVYSTQVYIYKAFICLLKALSSWTSCCSPQERVKCISLGLDGLGNALAYWGENGPLFGTFYEHQNPSATHHQWGIWVIPVICNPPHIALLRHPTVPVLDNGTPIGNLLSVDLVEHSAVS